MAKKFARGRLMRLPTFAFLWLLTATVIALMPGQATGIQHSQRVQSPQDPVLHLYRRQVSHARFAFRAVARDSTVFDQFWREVVGDSNEPRPAVDFDKYMVVVATMGPKPSTGYHISVRAVDSVAGAIRIHLDLSSSSGGGCSSGGMITSPADVVRVPRSGRVITFVERFLDAHC